jgi:hypothetical protein
MEHAFCFKIIPHDILKKVQHNPPLKRWSINVLDDFLLVESTLVRILHFVKIQDLFAQHGWEVASVHEGRYVLYPISEAFLTGQSLCEKLRDAPGDPGKEGTPARHEHNSYFFCLFCDF